MRRSKRLQLIIERLEGYREEVKGFRRKHSVLMSEDVYIEDVDWLLSKLRELGKKK